MRAQKKFAQLDADGNGVLEGPELFGLSEWVWSSFHPGGQPMSEEEKQTFGAKLLGRLDENSDGMMSFDEFGGWFRRTCASIEKYRRGLAQKKKKPALPLTVGDKKKGGLTGADLYKLYAKDAAAGGRT